MTPNKIDLITKTTSRLRILSNMECLVLAYDKFFSLCFNYPKAQSSWKRKNSLSHCFKSLELVKNKQ